MIKNILILCISTIYIFANNIELSGTVISDNEKVITSRNMGFIKDVYVSEGSFVKKGQLLYEIDSSSIDSLKQEALLNLKMQENKLANIKVNYNRYKRLYKQDLVPKYDVEQLELNLINMKNMILIAKAKLKEVNFQYNYLKIKAPNDGLIIKKSIKAGEMSMPSAPALILSDLSSLKIRTDISENNLGKIKINQEVKVSIPSINLETRGKIDAIIPNINTVTHSFILKISFDKKELKVYPGMYAKLLIEPLR
ncbi:efflux RND transporter periplasmic adaptor subunit [Poseidonibacter ostreae]|uniref:efflux RND transporter periplasmic adaptor subunit n=1 Tax=Poseidonibacter ostreae TaxID=2654171 RepID=UPI00186B22E2|nr:efflux RND transporter periplasmic adaptor subunit [Poseidonibacter ostreae]|tara:strand:- start:2083 stop:2841 length:759 start_codon:yes stop_codon:yes gene_type:complete